MVLNHLGLEDTDFKAVLNGDFFDLYGRSQIHFLHLIHFFCLMIFVCYFFKFFASKAVNILPSWKVFLLYFFFFLFHKLRFLVTLRCLYPNINNLTFIHI